MLLGIDGQRGKEERGKDVGEGEERREGEDKG